MKLLIGTSKGLIFWNDGNVKELIPGSAYGISKLNNDWYCYLSGRNNEGLYKLVFDGDELVATTKVLALNPAVHQIDFIDEQLYIADTRQNQILIYPTLTGTPQALLPNGVHAEPPSTDHLHLNSIYRYGDKLYVLAHNLGIRLSRQSDIYIYELSTLSLYSKQPLDGKACHNLYVDKDGILFLDSSEGRLMRGSTEILRLNGFLRGLAVTAQHYIIGVSIWSSRSDRTSGPASIVILDRFYNKVGEYKLDTQIFEIRAFDCPDYSMSNTCH